MPWTLRISILLAGLAASPAWSQATARICGAEEAVGPACLLARTELAALPAGPLFWHLDRFPTQAQARRAALPSSTIAEAFGSVWLFTLERRRWRPRGGSHVTAIGPLPVQPAPSYAAEYLRSVFSPGMTAPLHVHSGPEAFYALDGDTCLESPEGARIGRGPGNSLVIAGGPPMLLMAIGKAPRRGFALILHDAGKPPTTLVHDWQPKGVCRAELPVGSGK